MGSRLATPTVNMEPSSVIVGATVYAAWTPDPATGSYTYRTTIDGSPDASSRVDGTVGAVDGVALTPSGVGRFCIFVTAIAVPGVVMAGTLDSAESVPACTTVVAASAGEPSPLPSPSPMGTPAAGAAGIEFAWAPVADPDVHTYSVTLTYEGTTLATQTGLPRPAAYHSFANGGAPGEYCGVAQAFPRFGTNRTPSPPSPPLCHTKVS